MQSIYYYIVLDKPGARMQNEGRPGRDAVITMEYYNNSYYISRTNNWWIIIIIIIIIFPFVSRPFFGG